MSAPEQPSPLVRRSGMPMYLVENLPRETVTDSRNTIGGRPVLPATEPWPLCYCGERMMLFFQLDIPSDIPDFGGDHLLVFQCPSHDDAVCLKEMLEQLPERYWEAPPIWQHPGAFWRILLHRDETGPADDVEPHLDARRLALRPDTETLTIWRPDRVLADGAASDEACAEHGVGRPEFKIGGTPSWAQDPESYRCACGAQLVFLCQVPEDTAFYQHPGTVTSNRYGLFLGNEVYILACPAHCHPAAAWPVNQN